MYKKLSDREQGQGLVEYALILVLVAVAVIVLLGTLGDTVAVVFARVSATMSGQIIGTSGTDIIIQDLDATVSSPNGGANCSLVINNITVMVFEDGEILESGSATLTYSVNGSSTSQAFTISGVSSSVAGGSYSVPCPAVVTSLSGYSAEFYP